jgi:hypothetical protein
VPIDRQVGKPRRTARAVARSPSLERQAPFGLPVLPDVNEIIAVPAGRDRPPLARHP